MRGVNFVGWFSQVDAIQEKDPATFPGLLEHLRSFLGPEDACRVRDWGFDHVRLPLDWQILFQERDLSPREEVLALLDRAVDSLLGAGLEVILDLHKCPGHDFHQGTRGPQAFFIDPARRRDTLAVWKILAGRYGPRGVMLELLNEPVAPSAEIWNEVQAELAEEVRRVAPRSTLVLASNLWNGAGEFERLAVVPDPNVLYTFHCYTPLVFTHQFAPWLEGDVFRQRRAYPGTYDLPPEARHRLPLDRGRWDRARLAESLEQVFRFRDRHQVRVACTEFGVYVGGPDRISQLRWIRDLLQLFREHGVGWTYWNYKNLDFGLISRGERLFESIPSYANPERLDQELLALLLAV